MKASVLPRGSQRARYRFTARYRNQVEQPTKRLSTLERIRKIHGSVSFWGKGNVVMLFSKSLALQTNAILIDPEGTLVVLDVIYNGKTFNLVVTDAPNRRHE